MSQIQRLIDNWETEIRRGAIQLLVCAVLSDDTQRMHGKAICDAILEKTGNVIDVPLGTVYPLLRRFVNEELIETMKSDEDARKTIYILKDSGKDYYTRMVEMWNRYSVAVSNVLHD